MARTREMLVTGIDPAMATDSFPAQPSIELGEQKLGRITLPRVSVRLDGWVIAASLSVLMLVSLWLRTRSFNAFYWIDEGISVGIAGHPLQHIPTLLRQDGSPPLYYLILHVWMSAFGHGEVATHALSLLFALVLIPVAYWAGASIFDRLTGLICAGIAAFAPYLTTYAQETRMYTLLALLTLIVAASFVHAFILHHRRYLPVFSVSLALSLYTHNWALFLALMCGVAYLVCLRRAEDQRALLRDGLIGFGVALLLYAPWLPTLAYQAGHTGAPWDLPPVIWSLSQGAYALVGGRGAAVAFLLAGGSGLMALWSGESARSAVRLTIVTLLILGVGTMLLAWLYSKITPAWADRYLAVIVGPLLLLFGVGISRTRWLGAAAALLLAVFWLLAPIAPARYAKSNVQPIAAHVHREVNTRTLVISTQPEQVPVLSYYLPHARRFGTPMDGLVPDPHIVDWRDALSHLRRASVRGTLMPMLDTVAPGETVLLVIPQDLAKAPLWLKLIRHDSAAWLAALKHDKQFRLVKLTQAGAGGAGVPLSAALFVKR